MLHRSPTTSYSLAPLRRFGGGDVCALEELRLGSFLLQLHSPEQAMDFPRVGQRGLSQGQC